ncbi:hypothetical protein G6O69_24770 [Pseudenhygromyxa sp. WMMC2535]|uniref:hypothetical protein n=1 Tax=Pseudenhygromyxa sp. WMMC2535 TaxID=2712867 RepID=UPI001595D099|nr:hypothetical protein [Pseudenhygromyxa sp. WMMC2535]NVB41076.1 hypothetical protein [Pseudenhygromyxa sp. WMMC2535]
MQAHQHRGVGASVDEGEHDDALLAGRRLKLRAIDGAEAGGCALGSAVEADARAAVWVEPDDPAEARQEARSDALLGWSGEGAAGSVEHGR